MSIRIGNTVYIPGLAPVDVAPFVAERFELLAEQYEVNADTLDDLIANTPGGIVRVGLKRPNMGVA